MAGKKDSCVRVGLLSFLTLGASMKERQALPWIKT